MKFIETKISELIIVEPTLFVDARGYFLESYNQKKLEEVVGKISFVQDNESKSYKGVLRGLHFQKPPFDQAKLVRCIDGEVLDVVVDIRKIHQRTASILLFYYLQKINDNYLCQEVLLMVLWF